MSIEILWEEPSALVVNKPSGVLTQGAAGIDTMETRLLSFLKERDQHPGNPYVGLPHRLDRCVSGTLLVARNLRAVQRFGAQFQSRKVTKIYWAIAAGKIPASEQLTTWTDMLKKIPGRPVAEIATLDDAGAKSAVLHFRVLKHLEASDRMPCDRMPCTWVEVRLETGRMHQIRLQFASRGFPLLGDSMYGSEVRFGPAVDDEREKAIALHAREIRFRHPKTGTETSVVAPVGGSIDHQSVRNPYGWEMISRLS